MLIKNFFFLIFSLIDNINFYLFILLISVSYYFIFTNLRKKFISFVFILFLISIWGFLFDLDGMILILMITEFTLLLLFFMTYIQLYTNFTFYENKIYWNFIFLISIILFYFSSTNYLTSSYISYYNSLQTLISADFYILFYILFNKLPILIIFFTLIISLFSFFFILLYFNLKQIKNQYIKKNKQIQLLRKQNLNKQTTFNSKLYTFQN